MVAHNSKVVQDRYGMICHALFCVLVRIQFVGLKFNTMKYTSETFARHKRMATIGNDLPLAVAYIGKKRDDKPTAHRDALEEKSIYRKTPRGTRNIQSVQAKIWR